MMTPHGRSTPGPNVTTWANSPDRRSAVSAGFGGAVTTGATAPKTQTGQGESTAAGR